MIIKSITIATVTLLAISQPSFARSTTQSDFNIGPAAESEVVQEQRAENLILKFLPCRQEEVGPAQEVR